MIKAKKQEAKSCVSNYEGKDLHIILTYRHEIEMKMVKKDILSFLRKVQMSIKNNFEYCYTVRPITDKHPAVHILIRSNKKLNESELKSFWDKGIAKASVVTPTDKRAMDYYLNSWGSKVHCSRSSQ